MEIQADQGDGRLPEVPSSSPRRRRRVLLGTLVGVAVLVVAIVAGALWVGSRALAARDSLQRAESLVGELRSAVVSDPSAAQPIADRLVSETASARQDTAGAVWSAAEGVPILGRNLSVVRRLTLAVDDVARKAVRPLAHAGAAVLKLKPVGGAVDLDVVRDVARTVSGADSALLRARNQVHDIDAGGTIAQVSDARARLGRLLDDAADTAGPAAKAASILVPLLGGDGPRTYLLLFQNPAEAVPLGGNPASVLLVRADKGAISIVGQASSNDFTGDVGSPIPLDPHLTQVYYERFPQLIQDIGGRPDFPTMARLGKGFWERDFGGRVDAVFSFDPVALADLITATGPVVLPSGDTVTSSNAVSLLLYEVYARYPKPADQDAFFKSAAVAVFEKLTSGAADPAALLKSLSKAAAEGRLMAWSDHPDEQKVIAQTPLSGILPADSSVRTTVGVYFDDFSASKLDYFLDTAVTASADACSPKRDPVFTITYSLNNRLTQEKADTMPPYVAGASVPRGHIHSQIYVLGPPGSKFLDWSVKKPGMSDELVLTGSDLERPVVRLDSYLGTGGSTTVSVRFKGPAGHYGPLEVRTTPMVNPTTVAVEQPTCG